MPGTARFPERRQIANKKGPLSELTEIAQCFSLNRCTMLGASIAFYSAFSLAPTLLIVLAVAGWFFGKDAARGELFAHIKSILGPDSAAAMQDLAGACALCGRQRHSRRHVTRVTGGRRVSDVHVPQYCARRRV
jgi:membrane protein